MSATNRKAEVRDDVSAELGFGVRVLSKDGERAAAIAQELEFALRDWLGLQVGSEGFGAQAGAAPGQGETELPNAVFIDAESKGYERALARVDRARDAAYLIVEEGAELPSAWIEGHADDVLVYPFRPIEVLSKLRQFQWLLEWRETTRLNAEYAQALEKMQENLELAQKLQKSKLPTRFPDVRGLKVTSRYLAGTRSGGNYVDMAESRDGNQVAVVLTDSSSYRLSSQIALALPRVMSGLTLDEVRSSLTTARRVRDGVLATLQDQDRLSLFYGTFSRKDYKFRYVNLGGSRAFWAPSDKPFAALEQHGDAIQRATGVRAEREGEITLEAEGRLVLLSDGFVRIAGGETKLLELMNQLRQRARPGQDDAKDLVNELVFRVKSVLPTPDDLPAQDCTAAVFDVDARVLRLA